MFASKSSSLTYVTLLIIANVALSQAMLPPPMLRAVCGAFADAEEVVGTKALAVGKAAADLALKPIAIVGGLKAAAVGTGMKVGGAAIKFAGEKMVKDGLFFEATGAGIKGAGLGVAALGLKPLAEKIVVTGKAAEGSIAAGKAAAENLVHSVGDTSIQIDATIDSPLIGHHHKEVNVTAGLETAIHNPNFQQQIEGQHPISKRAAKIDADVMRAALSLVKEAKMEDCVARAICDLNCNPQGFGHDGKQVFLNMVRLQGSNVLEQSESKYFHEAASRGRTNSGKCNQCSTVYSKCNSKSADLIKLASHISMD